MQVIWNAEGVRVWLTGVDATTDPCFVGYAEIQHPSENTRIGVRQWRAYPSPIGYRVVMSIGIGAVTEWQGPTLNLGLEVAKAVRK